MKGITMHATGTIKLERGQVALVLTPGGENWPSKSGTTKLVASTGGPRFDLS